jgi:D-aminoacyl-tRNA deacylase
VRALIQRVTSASVEVGGECVGRIEHGLLVFLGVQRGDTTERADAMAARLLAYRVFNDADGRMNLDVRAIRGSLLVVSQFTLAADTRKGLRPGFSEAAEPPLAKALYDRIVENLRGAHAPVACGIFAADMRVSLVNDGPVTFLLET